MSSRVIPLACRVVRSRPGDAELELEYEVHEYLRFESVSVRETEREVEIIVKGRLDPPDGGWSAYGEPERRTVALKEPLGSRGLSGSEV
jgi:hypothetical protein